MSRSKGRDGYGLSLHVLAFWKQNGRVTDLKLAGRSNDKQKWFVRFLLPAPNP